MKKLACVVALGGAFLSLDAAAWGYQGHRAVGAMADQLIAGTRAQKEVAALLLPGESLEKISVWPDCVKGTSCGPQTPEMLEYVAANPQHSEYHYTDIPFQNAQYRDGAVGSARDDIVQTLKQAIAVLQGKGDDVSNPHHFTRRQALILITHLAGDISQPLHVGNGYVAKEGGFALPRTKAQIDEVNIFSSFGGNDFLLDDSMLASVSAKLIPAAAGDSAAPVHVPPSLPAFTSGDGKPAATAPVASTRSLHSYWDSTVVDYAMRRIGARTPEQFAQMIIAGKPVVAAGSGDPISWPYQWADDALVAAKVAFADMTPGEMSQRTTPAGKTYNVWKMAMPADYPVPSSALAKTQLTKGGYRLAALLEAIWPQQ